MVAGQFIVGADCAETRTDKTREMTVHEFVEFLEPTADRAGAVCQSAADYNHYKTVIEQLCYKAGDSCQYEEVKKAMDKIDALLVNAQDMRRK